MLEKVEKPKTLKDTALEQLRLAIMIGQLAPGQRLVERTICEQLGVSRTVVRVYKALRERAFGDFFCRWLFSGCARER